MDDINNNTDFAPVKRSGGEEIHAQSIKLRAELVFGAVMDSVPEIVFILNKDRQIIYANKRAIEIAGTTQITGMRHGEALHCQNAKSPGGCGTSSICRYCGAMRAIVTTALLGKPFVQECHLTVTANGSTRALDLTVSTYPVDIDGETFTVLHAADIAADKRMEVVGQIFFHDMLNTMTALSGFLEIVDSEAARLPANFQGYFSRAKTLAAIIQDEMLSHRLLVAAESGPVPVNPVKLNIAELLRRIANFYGGCNIAHGKTVEVICVEGEIETDKSFLTRTIIAMLKNALEETEKGGKITAGCALRGETAVFSVHNDKYMEKETQMQVFTRSFTTKGKGRGLGTWSMKLFGEQFLKGKVSFETDKEKGTTFFLELPLKFPA